MKYMNVFLTYSHKEIEMAEDRKTEILQAFMKLVSRFGLDKTTMQDIAKEAGVSVGVIYKDYTNKEDLVDAYANHIVTIIMHEYQTLIDKTQPPEEQLHNLVIGSAKVIHRCIIDDLGIHQILADDISMKYIRKNFSRKAEINKHYVGLVSDVMQVGVEQGVFQIEDIPKTAALFIDAFEGYYMNILFEGKNFDKLLPKLEAMYQFLIRIIKK